MINENVNYFRYSRQILIPEIGMAGQKKLSHSKVLIVGCGGLGAPVSLYLTAAGVGTIGLVEYDIVDESNLQRQILYKTKDINKEKIYLAKTNLNELSPETTINIHPEKMNIENAIDIISEYDVIVDCTDEFSIRYIIGDACCLSGKPEVYGAIFRFEGQVSVLNTKNSPSYRELFPVKPLRDDVIKASEGGVIGTLAGIIGSIQANEVIKLITGVGNTLEGRLFILNALTMKTKEINTLSRLNTNVNLKTKKQFYTENQNNTITNKGVIGKIKRNVLGEFALANAVFVIDVREKSEAFANPIQDSVNIPISSMISQIKKIRITEKGKKILIYSDGDNRSNHAACILQERGVSSIVIENN